MKLLDHTAYTKQFEEKKIAECKCEDTCKCPYPRNDIGTAQLFYDLHKDLIINVSEAKSWYYYDEKRWAPDVGGMYTSELCKGFVRAYIEYAKNDQDFKEYVEKFHKLNQRNGATSSPDIARLQGIRFVNMPEPAKGLELDAALVKQLTGGDSVTARFLFKNFVEFKPAFKIFISTNHMPKVKDRTVFDSGRMKVIPFNRHFKPDEQNRNLKESFRNPSTMSGILNWLIEGYNAYKKDGRLIVPDEIKAELKDFQKVATAEIDGFLKEFLIKADGVRLKTSLIHKFHCEWAKEREFSPLSSQAFVAELRSRYEVKRNGAKGNIVAGYTTKIDEFLNKKLETATGKLKVKDAYDSYCKWSEKPVKLSAQLFDFILQEHYEVKREGKDDVVVGVTK